MLGPISEGGKKGYLDFDFLSAIQMEKLLELLLTSNMVSKKKKKIPSCVTLFVHDLFYIFCVCFRSPPHYLFFSINNFNYF